MLKRAGQSCRRNRSGDGPWCNIRLPFVASALICERSEKSVRPQLAWLPGQGRHARGNLFRSVRACYSPFSLLSWIVASQFARNISIIANQKFGFDCPEPAGDRNLVGLTSSAVCVFFFKLQLIKPAPS